MTNILLTGGAGYVGSHIAKVLLKQGYNVNIIDNLSTGFIKSIDTLKKYNNVKFIKADLKDEDIIEKIFKENKFEAVFHFSANTILEESIDKPSKYYENNTINTLKLLNICLKYKVNKFIFSSTAAVYGEKAKSPIKEETPCFPKSPYGKSKLFAEEIIKDIAIANKNFKYVILRYFNVVGADIENELGQNTKNASHLMKISLQTALGLRDNMYIYGDDYKTKDGTCIRDFIDINDLANAHLSAYEYLKNNESNIFNVGYGQGFSVKELINTVKKISGVNFNVDIANRRKADIDIVISDNKKILEKTNWEIKYNNLEKIVENSLLWEKKILKNKIGS